MNPWFWYALAAAVLCGAHQIFTRLTSDHIGDGLGGFVVEATTALTILCYLLALRFRGRWNQPFTIVGFWYSVLTGLCVGAGTVAFFLLFQRDGPLSAAPAILAGGAPIMAVAGIGNLRLGDGSFQPHGRGESTALFLSSADSLWK